MTKFLQLSLLIFIVPALSFGQNHFRSPGVIEVGGGLSFSSQSASGGGETITDLAIDIFFGYMVAPGFEIGLRPGLVMLTNSSQTESVYNVYLNPEYNFHSSADIYPTPFVGLLIGYNAASNVENGTTITTLNGLGYGGEIGFKFNLNTNDLLFLKFEYLVQSLNSKGSSGHDIDNINFGVGFRIFFTKKVKSK